MNKEMLTEISKQHEECKRLVAEARTALVAVTDKAITVAALIEKAQRHHKSTIHGFLSPIMSGIESRAYLTAHQAARTRDIKTDKRVLQKIGVMDTAPPREKAASTKAPPSLTTKIAKANAEINKSLSKRPVSAMSQGERQVLKTNLEGLARVYVEASR